MTKGEILFSVLVISCIITMITSTVKTDIRLNRFNENFRSHLYVAQNTNDINIYKQELKLCLDYLETNNLTQGSTDKGIENDIGLWYNNLKDAYNKINALSDNSTSLEEEITFSNVKQVLNSKIPRDIELYPYMTLYHILFAISLNLLIISIFILPYFL